MSSNKTAWNLKQLKDAYVIDVAACRSDFERSMVKAITGPEVRALAAELSRSRTLTPGEVAIAQEFGWRPAPKGWDRVEAGLEG